MNPDNVAKDLAKKLDVPLEQLLNALEEGDWSVQWQRVECIGYGGKEEFLRKTNSNIFTCPCCKNFCSSDYVNSYKTCCYDCAVDCGEEPCNPSSSDEESEEEEEEEDEKEE